MNQKLNDIGVLAEQPQVIGNLADGRLTYKQLREDGTIEVTLSNIADDDSTRVELQMFAIGGSPIPESELFVVASKDKATEPGGVWSFPLVFTVDVRGLFDVFDAAGNYVGRELAFVVYEPSGNPDTSSPHAVIFVDLTAPWQRQPGTGNRTGARPPPRLASTPPVPTVINDAWLNDPANAGGLNLVLSTAYTKFEAGVDQATVYISRQTTYSLMRAETPAYAGPLNAGGIVNVPLAFLRLLIDGNHFIAYDLRDGPGNISNNSLITPVFQVTKAPAPVLGLPRIPVTGTDGNTPIMLSTVGAPPPSRAVMEIDIHGTWLPGDRIIPYMQSVNTSNQVSLPEQPVPAPGGATVMRFELGYDKMNEVFDGDDGQDEVQFEYWYELARSSITPNPTSRSAFGLVDFSYAGPEQPNLPDLQNPNIPTVIVQGAGTATPPPNTLGPEQAGLDAQMQAPLISTPERPVTGREIYTFYYQGKQVGVRSPTAGQTTPVTCPLPWQTIRDEGNGTGVNARKAYVTIELPGGNNVMRQTPDTNVNVTAIVINLPVPQVIVSAYMLVVPGQTPILVPERIATLVNCPSLNHPAVVGGAAPPYLPRRLRIRIRRDINIPTGTPVTVAFEGRTTDTLTGALITGTEMTVTQNMPATGDLEVFLTDYPRIRLIQLPPTGIPPQRPANRFARIAYTANGVTAVVTLTVSLLNSSLVYCEQERPEPTP
ncbi:MULTISPECIES: hypothetical protein [unclassified Pseudomonas]|uniref:hypothetical protein n=1 Tax=unclassified Pseudomonas TaxID=196821 RepID=UPI002AC96C03|nr:MULTISPECIES: hypothetical protein [unclassified Pseudomonas]MEB0045272.1 hypothetical protein [Pseudomonas sp. Dout3]MEB0096372.1 hypothetical protein [Pseudomonas sp. DC1.2]WPX61330.1 hypothetical protein RHM68_12050 [Pseudomonas sp. DC1.2]